MAVTLDTSLASAVVEQAASGDEVAFARIVNAYHADLVRVAYVTCGDADMAQDAVQAAWTIAWRKMGSVRDPARVKSWLVAVAANEARQLIRRHRRRSIVELNVDRPGNAADDPAALIDRVDLVNALGRLKPEDRMLLALRYVAGVDSTELGERLGMSPSGTRAHLARLLKRLHKDLDHG